jgi:hypothetical protein
MERKYKRRNFFINPNFQTRFICASLILSLFSLTAVYVAQQYFFMNFIDQGVMNNIPADHAFYKIIGEQQNSFNTLLLGLAGVFTLGSIIWGGYFSHRIAGPMYKLNKYFTDAVDENKEELEPLFFRENDFFHEIPRNINIYLDSKNSLKK